MNRKGFYAYAEFGIGGFRDLGKMPCDSVENKMAICPLCKDTNILVSSTCKISNPPIYTLACQKCMVIWEANL